MLRIVTILVFVFISSPGHCMEPEEADNFLSSSMVNSKGLNQQHVLSQHPEALDREISSKDAELYLQEVFAIIKSHSVMRKKVDWKKLEDEAFQLVSNAQKTSDTYPAIYHILDKLGDNHSFLMKQITSEALVEEKEDNQLSFNCTKGEMLHHKIGYILLSGFSSRDDQTTEKYALHINEIIKNLAKLDPCGWVLDLRQNGGGNMWPMLAGVAALLGDGKLGSFVDPDGNEDEWSCKEGKILSEAGVMVEYLPQESIYRIPANSPITVLIGPDTASSGEAITVSFKGRPHTRFFGQKTSGLSSANQGFPLTDGAELFLTTAYFADRHQNIYTDGISPDEFTSEGENHEDSTLKKATEWLLDQSK
ncbi:MAG: S41 family peptidase [Alphaproteobacteria bacterium]|nr:S41 family peptidase [Alphaproteobacteria bacterium]